MKLILSCLAAGAAIGMLLAPESGEKTRKKISSKVGDLKDKWINLKSMSAEELEEMKEVFQQEISGLKENTRQRVLEMIDALKRGSNRLKEQAVL